MTGAADTYTGSGGGVVAPARVIAAGSPNERQALLDDMMRGLPPDSGHRSSIGTAAESFSTPQLRRMHQAGVIFADASGVPASRQLPGTHSASPLNSVGRYLPESRVVQLSDRAGVGDVRHELAHAWDDVGNDRERLRDDAARVQRERVMVNLHHQDVRGQIPNLERRLAALPEGSPARARLEEQLGEARALTRGVRPGATSDTALAEAFDAYRGRISRREQAFDTSAAEGHSLRSPREFYAEGFNTFHAGDASRARLRETAPELYRFLYREAERQGTLPAGAALP